MESFEGNFAKEKNLQGQAAVDFFNQADAGWVQGSETNRVISGEQGSAEVMHLTFEPLSASNLAEAKKFADEVFALEKGLAGADLESQIHPPSHKEDGHGGEIDKHYWMVKSDNGEMLGITGFSSFDVDKPEHCWLGWFALKSGLRGARMGEQLLEKAMTEAKTLGKKEMYIVSSDHPDMAGNAKFYHKNDFPIVVVMDKRGIHVSEKSKELPQALLQKLRGDYDPFVEDGVNIFLRRRILR